MLERIVTITTLISLCLLSILLVTTTPGSVGPFGLLVIFISAYLACIGLISFFLFGFSRAIGYMLAIMKVRAARFQPLPYKRAYYFSTVLAAAPVMLIGLQSVGSVGIYEVILVTLFTLVGCIYIAKRLP
ncbi:MAG TPA: hypothetical protein PLY16_02640 [Candidatus Saccharibacteria bacterium]|nr:hypothetical protein [Candidatus Saccharibacteria bacterium]